MGTLRIPNEMFIANPNLVKQCIDWLKQNHDAIVHGKYPERKCMRYEITGEGIPDKEFHLNIHHITEDVFTITIIDKL